MKRPHTSTQQNPKQELIDSIKLSILLNPQLKNENYQFKSISFKEHNEDEIFLNKIVIRNHILNQKIKIMNCQKSYFYSNKNKKKIVEMKLKNENLTGVDYKKPKEKIRPKTSIINNKELFSQFELKPYIINEKDYKSGYIKNRYIENYIKGNI